MKANVEEPIIGTPPRKEEEKSLDTKTGKNIAFWRATKYPLPVASSAALRHPYAYPSPSNRTFLTQILLYSIRS
ncbi:unnamed protein product [Hymenolepis diminuta]|uniref:Uncharacterized protein n=1 Tax=Hymenolepis diminuta TaxID=6216 RepID=A0A564YEF2_HYMDI|nr:unnamed protein product [Hymenolepis diminuta]